MHKTIQNLALLIVLCLFGAMLTGCGKNENVQATNSAPANPDPLNALKSSKKDFNQ